MWGSRPTSLSSSVEKPIPHPRLVLQHYPIFAWGVPSCIVHLLLQLTPLIPPFHPVSWRDAPLFTREVGPHHLAAGKVLKLWEAMHSYLPSDSRKRPDPSPAFAGPALLPDCMGLADRKPQVLPLRSESTGLPPRDESAGLPCSPRLELELFAFHGVTGQWQVIQGRARLASCCSS